MKKRIFTTGLLASMLMIMSCSSDDRVEDKNITTTEVTEATVLKDLTNEVIINTYKNLDEKASALVYALSELRKNPTEENLAKAKKAWTETRKPWEQSEGFLYGPVDEFGLDPALDTWPVNVEAMNAVIASNQPITASLIATNDEARGFHLIEFLLWGEDGKKKASEITDRQKEYLVAAAQDLQSNTSILYQNWRPEGGNFAQYFLTADKGNAKYPSTKAAVEEIVSGLYTIANEVGATKIADSFNEQGGTPKYEDEESRFSNNSKEDFADNIRSIKNIYTGEINGKDVKGIDELIAKQNPELNTKIKAKIDACIKAINELPGTYTQAITSNRPAVAAAQKQVNELADMIKNELGKIYPIN